MCYIFINFSSSSFLCTDMKEIQTAMGTLAFVRDAECEPLSAHRPLFDHSRWQRLIADFQKVCVSMRVYVYVYMCLCMCACTLWHLYATRREPLGAYRPLFDNSRWKRLIADFQKVCYSACVLFFMCICVRVCAYTIWHLYAMPSASRWRLSMCVCVFLLYVHMCSFSCAFLPRH